MIPAVAQTLAEILACGTSLNSTEQIDFNPPCLQSAAELGLNLYCYNIRESNPLQPVDPRIAFNTNCEERTPISSNSSPVWFDVSFLVSAWDCTALGEQRLLSEVLILLLRHRLLREELLAPELRGYGSLPIKIASVSPIDTVALLNSLGVPLRPTLHVTVTIPFDLNKAPPLSQKIWLSSTR